MPIAWTIAFAVVAGVLKLAACSRATTVMQLLRPGSMWLLAIIFPAFLFGLTVGLIGMNVFAYFTPLRGIFEREGRETGRHDFAAATMGLVRFALMLLGPTLVGMVAYLLFAP